MNRTHDMSNLDIAKSLAESLGIGYVVYVHPLRPLVYEVCHISRTGMYHPDWVVFQTVRKGQAYG